MWLGAGEHHSLHLCSVYHAVVAFVLQVLACILADNISRSLKIRALRSCKRQPRLHQLSGSHSDVVIVSDKPSSSPRLLLHDKVGRSWTDNSPSSLGSNQSSSRGFSSIATLRREFNCIHSERALAGQERKTLALVVSAAAFVRDSATVSEATLTPNGPSLGDLTLLVFPHFIQAFEASVGLLDDLVRRQTSRP